MHIFLISRKIKLDFLSFPIMLALLFPIILDVIGSDMFLQSLFMVVFFSSLSKHTSRCLFESSNALGLLLLSTAFTCNGLWAMHISYIRRSRQWYRKNVYIYILYKLCRSFKSHCGRSIFRRALTVSSVRSSVFACCFAHLHTNDESIN